MLKGVLIGELKGVLIGDLRRVLKEISKCELKRGFIDELTGCLGEPMRVFIKEMKGILKSVLRGGEPKRVLIGKLKISPYRRTKKSSEGKL